MTGNGVGRQDCVEDGALVALIDGELSPAERRDVEARVRECGECAQRRDALRFLTRRVSAALDALPGAADEAAGAAGVPEMPPKLRRAAALARAPRRRGLAWTRGAARLGRRPAAVAAGLTLLVSAAAYAMPGSPVRGWVDERLATIAAWIRGDEPTAPVGPSRVSVDPADGAIRVSFHGSDAVRRLTIRLSDEAQATVAAREASFRVEPGVIEVAGAPAEVVVTLPRGAQAGSVVVGGAEVVRVEGGAWRLADAEAPIDLIFEGAATPGR